MRKTFVIWSIVFVIILGCAAILINYPRDISSIKLENGIKITLELNENILSMRDPDVSKKITINYDDRQLKYRCTYDDYDYCILLLKQNEDTTWVLQERDGYQTVECSFSDKKADFLPKYSTIVKGGKCDTLLNITYKNFKFSVQDKWER